MPALPTKLELEAERLRRSFPRFVVAAWPVIEPDPFLEGIHIEAICACLSNLASGAYQRLLINVPPRHTKSTLCSVLWPAWVWASRPETRFLIASFGQQLALRDSVRCRRLIESPWYQLHWPHVQLRPDQNAKERFENDRGGARLATSVGGSATGEGGDIILIDDPHKIEEATSAAQRDATIDWYTSTISTRLNDPQKGGIVVIGQRLHEHDLCGHLLGEGGWHHLCLPAEYEPNHPNRCAEDPRATPGCLLWPSRYGPEQIAKLKQTLGSYAAAGQLQQRPAPAGGGVFQRHWWNWYDPRQPLPELEEIVQAWDLAFSDGLHADYVVGQAWGKNGQQKYLLHQIRARLSFTQTLTAIAEMTARLDNRLPRHHGHPILIEKAANAAAAIDVLKQHLPAVIGVEPQGNKLTRAHAVAPQIEAGQVSLPGRPNADHSGYDRNGTPAWVQDFIAESESFPNGAHDDQIDAMSYALRRLTQPGPQLHVFRSQRRPRRRW